MAYGIICDGGPKRMSLVVGTSVTELPMNGGVVSFVPDVLDVFGRVNDTFVKANHYPFKSKTEAISYLKRARAARARVFLGYDGYSKPKVIENNEVHNSGG